MCACWHLHKLPGRAVTHPSIEQPPLLAGAANIDLAVPLFQSRVIRVNVPTTRMSVANPDVADIVVISPTELYVLGKDLGSTNVWYGPDNRLIGSVNIEVQHDLDSLKRSSPSCCGSGD